MFYDRKIKYLDYIENGDKVKSAGFVKMEVAGENCNIQISVSGLYRTDTLQREVWISDGARETVLGEIGLETGKGSLTLKKQAASGLGKEPIAYGDLYEIRIRLAKNRELRCQWGANRQGSGGPVSERAAVNVEELRQTDGGTEEKRPANAALSAGGGNGSGMEPVPSRSRIKGEPEWDGIVTGKDDGAQGLLYVKWMEKIDSVPSAGGKGVTAGEAEQKAELREGGWLQEEKVHMEEFAAGNRELSGEQEQMYQHVNDEKLSGSKEVKEGSENREGEENGADLEVKEGGENREGEENGADREVKEGSENREGKENGADREVLENSAIRDMKETGENREVEDNSTNRKREETEQSRETKAGVNRGCQERKTIKGVYEQPEAEERWREPVRPQEPVAQQNPSVPPNLFEDKWKQLCSLYPHISPFHDDRDYLSIGPSDFVILPGKYHKLVANSFLLHGYYNYEHLILTRMIKKGEERYYLGVPGNFYDREKQVAVMFGFESFECKREPAQTGDYGYFMMRVDI